MNFKWQTILLLFLVNTAAAQMSNERCKWVKTFDQAVTIDSLSIVAESIAVESGSFDYNISTGELTIKKDESQDSVRVCYKVFPIAFHQQYYHRDFTVYDSNAYFKDPVKPKPFLQQDQLFKSEGLYKSGSLSRGITFGNNQDVFVNSALNLNLDGQLTDNLFIRASITDQNVPYQPEGNTQQLQDFDNVFIELYNDKFSLIGGDVVFQNRPSNFLRYYKNVQGGLAKLNYDIGGNSAQSYLGVSVAKGQFASVQIEPVEGLAGPYRIPGPDNQRFLLILANSEKVFLDGEHLKRGFDEDYIIDYNSGEITFTNRVLITQFTRLRVDYEYSDQNYSRAITMAGHKQQIGNLKLAVDYYSENDNPNRPLLYDLTDQDRQLLSEIGDDLDLARISTFDSVSFTNETVLYRKRIINDPQLGSLEVFEYSTNPDSAFFTVSFSEVGFGNGDYILVTSIANGRIFEWIPPQNGQSQGNYSPTATLVTPNKRQMVTFNTEHSLGEHETVYSELAISNQDVNLYSDLNDDDNQAFAIKSGIKSSGRKLNFLPQFTTNAYIDYEYDEVGFSGIDRFRYIEFDRDWNYNSLNDSRSFSDQIINAGVSLANEHDLFSYDVTNRQRGAQVDGFQHSARVNKRLRRFRLQSHWFKMNNDVDSLSARWERVKADISYQTKNIIPGYIFHSDHNVVRTGESDSVSFSSMYFDEHTFYLKSSDTASFNYDLRHSIREDKAPLNGEINDFTTSQTTRLSLSKSFESHSIETIFNYRQLDNQNTDDLEETISGRLDWSGRWLDNHIRSELTYAIANSQELRREFVFIRVPPSQGTHTWRDLNNDGVQDISEFFEAINPDERNYAKIFTLTNDFIQAFQNLFILRLNIDAPRSWQKATGVKKLLSKFSNNTSWSADSKTTDSDLETRLLAFATSDLGTALISEKNLLRSTLFFNRTNPVYGIDFTYTNNTSKQLLINGFESRDIEEFHSNIRFNLSRQYSINLRSSRSSKEVQSDFIVDRNYFLNSYEMNPQISWQPSDNMRITVQYSLEDKRNVLTSESTEKAVLNEWVGELRLNKAVKSSINAQFRYINIDFNGEENSQVGYDMLEALRPGTNLTWTLNWQQKVTKGLQINLSYNGRKSESNDPVHIGRVQVSALF